MKILINAKIPQMNHLCLEQNEISVKFQRVALTFDQTKLNRVGVDIARHTGNGNGGP